VFGLFRRRNNASRFHVAVTVHQDIVSVTVGEFRAQGFEILLNDELSLIANSLATTYAELIKTYPRFLGEQANITLVLAAEHYQTVAVERPQLPANEVADSLKFTLRDLVSLEPGNMVVDYYDMPLQPVGQNNINVVAANKQLLKDWLVVAHKAKHKVVEITVDELCLAKLALSQVQQQPAMVLYQAANQLLRLQIIADGQLVLSRSIRNVPNLAGLSASQAEQAINTVLVEIQRSADFFESQLRQRSLNNLVIVIDSPIKTELEDAIEQQLGYQLERVNYPAWSRELARGNLRDLANLGVFSAFQSAANKVHQVAETEHDA